ncbi:MAG: alcohol dehydrogenase catalytic domain-containing protein, partial [Candidatus Acidiferrales bacterium]
MKAVVLNEYGGPAVLHVAEVPEPQIGANEVLVRVRACSLNHLDLWLRGGLPTQPLAFPHILGSDIAGEVAKIGSSVTSVR